MSRHDLRLGDSRDVLKTLEDNSIDSCVSDPPYSLTSIVKRFGNATADDVYKNVEARKLFNQGANPYARAASGFMGQKWDTGETAFDPEFWSEVLRVLKPGGYLLAFSGTRTYHRMACAIEDAGFEIRDQIGWTYGSGFPKSHDAGEGRGTALKPAWEPICMARKPLSEPTVAANVMRWGTGAINIDACRVPTDEEVIANHARTSDAAASKGIYGDSSGQETHQTDGQRLGRFPANLIHDGSDEVLALFPIAPGQLADISTTAPSPRMNGIFGPMSRAGEASADRCYNDSGVTNFAARPGARRGDSGSAARFFYCAKASRTDREEGCENLDDSVLAFGNGAQAQAERGIVHEKAGGGMSVARVRKNNHPTVKPTDLMRYLCRLVTPPGGLVLDPFMGSGSTGKAAMLEGFQFIGIEREANYMEIAKARVESGLRPREKAKPALPKARTAKPRPATDAQPSLLDLAA